MKPVSSWFLDDSCTKKNIKHLIYVHLHPFTVCWACSKCLITISPIVLWNLANPPNVFQNANRLQSTWLGSKPACPFCRVSFADLSSPIYWGDHGWNKHTIAYSCWYRPLQKNNAANQDIFFELMFNSSYWEPILMRREQIKRSTQACYGALKNQVPGMFQERKTWF